MMHTDERTFILRFSLTAEMPDGLLEDDEFDENAWRAEWETRVKPGLIREVFNYLRTCSGWKCYVRNRGIDPAQEVEVVVQKEFAAPTEH